MVLVYIIIVRRTLIDLKALGPEKGEASHRREALGCIDLFRLLPAPVAASFWIIYILVIVPNSRPTVRAPKSLRRIPLNIAKPIAIGLKLPDRMGRPSGISYFPYIVGVLGGIAPPLIVLFFQTAAGGTLPFGQGRKPVAVIGPVGKNPRLTRFAAVISRSLNLLV